MNNIALQLEKQAAGTVADSDNLIYDQVVSSSGNIEYEPLTGIITLKEEGRYFINWWLTLQTVMGITGAEFTLTASNGQSIRSNSPFKSGEITGNAIIDVEAPPVTLSLKNSSGGDAYLATTVASKSLLTIAYQQFASGGTADTSTSFMVRQMAHLLQQIIDKYPDSTVVVYVPRYNYIAGVPTAIYEGEGATGGSLLLFQDGATEATIPLSMIAAVYLIDPAVYDPSITYLEPPEPLPEGWDTDLMLAYKSYFTIGTQASIAFGPTLTASGQVYKNEYGIVVLADSDGNAPLFFNIRQIIWAFVTLTDDEEAKSTSSINIASDIENNKRIKKE